MSDSSDSDDEAMALIGLVLATKTRTHDMWVRDIFKRREAQSTYNLVREMTLGDEDMYYRYMRMTPATFEHILRLVAPLITKQRTNFREPISAAMKLSITLRHLATGETHISLGLQYRVGRATVSKLIPEVCKALYDVLAPEYLDVPKSPEEWLKIADRYLELWNLYHVLGALDGKHIRIFCPQKSGSLYHNYKGYFSMVLMAWCDADLNFVMFDIGHYGSNNDSGVLSNCEMGQRLAAGSLNFPEPKPIEGCSFNPLPYHLVGDEIFPLRKYLMRPYPGAGITHEKSIYNYRHSRGRRTIENTFGILANRWRIYHTPIQATPEHVERLVMATIVLHNFLRKNALRSYCPPGLADSEKSNGEVVPGQWRRDADSSQLNDIPNLRGQRAANTAVDMRDALKDFFNGPHGSVDFQYDRVPHFQ